MPQSRGADLRVRWYVGIGEAEKTIGDESQDYLLKSGWKCTAEKISKQLPSYEARQMSCRKGSEQFEFSAQCERVRPKDHTQIRFRAIDGKLVDAIMLGCELVEVVQPK
jgi:hypothetical protein